MAAVTESNISYLFSVTEISPVFDKRPPRYDSSSTGPRWIPPNRAAFLKSQSTTVTNRGEPPMVVEDEAFGKKLGLELFRRNSSTGDQWIPRYNDAFWSSQSRTVIVRKELPMVVEGKTISGRHDTGADENFMDEALSQKLGLELSRQKEDRAAFSMGNGRLVRAIGRVKAACTFAKEPGEKIESRLAINNGVSISTQDRNLDENRHRLQESHSLLSHIPSLKLISSSSSIKRRLHCRVNGLEEYVNADSGADLNFMSEDYARSHCYRIDRDIKRKIGMGDRSVAYTIGQTVSTITLDDETQWHRRFDILPDLTSNVVLSDESLELMEIWTQHEDSFTDVFLDQAQSLELNILVYLGEVANSISRYFRKQRRRDEEDEYTLSPSLMTRDAEDFRELHRRDAEAARIDSIQDEAQKQVDREREERRILRYERARR